MENETGATQPVTSPQTEAVSKKGLISKIVIWLVAVLILAAAVLAAGIYRLGWRGPVIESIERVVPFPAAVVNGHIVTLQSYRERYSAFKSALTKTQQYDFTDPANAQQVAEQKVALLQRMIDMKLQEALAAGENIKITQEEIDAEVIAIAQGTQTPIENFDSLISEIYGWDRKTFIDQVAYPQILERKLRNIVSQDTQYNAEQYARAQEVAQKLKDGGDFVKLAAEYSDDPGSKTTGGDLGWNEKGIFVPEFEAAIDSLEVGERSEIVTTAYGYHIIELLGRAPGDNGAVKTHVRHILVASKTFEEWFSEQVSGAKIWKFTVNVE